jgi:hypothetical protein
MTELGEGGEYAPLVEHRLGRTGLVAKLDKGFEKGVYCLYVEFGGISDRIGFTAARRQALDYCSRLQMQLANTEGYRLAALEDPSQSADPRRKHDMEYTFLSIAVTSEDGRWHDKAIKEKFRVALLRADQAWDQMQAGRDEERRDSRRERFRERLGTLLDGEAYRHVDAATRERLLAEVTALVFSPKGRSR